MHVHELSALRGYFSVLILNLNFFELSNVTATSTITEGTWYWNIGTKRYSATLLDERIHLPMAYKLYLHTHLRLCAFLSTAGANFGSHTQKKKVFISRVYKFSKSKCEPSL